MKKGLWYKQCIPVMQLDFEYFRLMQDKCIPAVELVL
jgi:hypothetical protein